MFAPANPLKARYFQGNYKKITRFWQQIMTFLWHKNLGSHIEAWNCHFKYWKRVIVDWEIPRNRGNRPNYLQLLRRQQIEASSIGCPKILLNQSFELHSDALKVCFLPCGQFGKQSLSRCVQWLSKERSIIKSVLGAFDSFFTHCQTVKIRSIFRILFIPLLVHQS